MNDNKEKKFVCPDCGGDPVVADIAKRMGFRSDIAYARICKLEDELFYRGAMLDSPCFCCGYDGPNYFDSDVHKCAYRHHILYNKI